MEVLSDILRAIRISASVYFCDRLEAPWTKDFVDTTSASFHMVRRGSCWAMVGERVERLGPGDLVFLGPGVDHRLSSERPGNGPATTTEGETLLLCGYCEFDADSVTPLHDVFPSLAIIRDEELIGHRWLRVILDQLSAEFLQQGMGAELVVDKLTEAAIVELIRINFGRDESNPFLAALRDDQISKALKLLHAAPEKPWTLESLAAEVAMSRAVFARRFTALVGQPMFQYLTTLRMQKARALLKARDLSIFDVAERVGYSSDLAFKKAFKRSTGMTPARFRKTAVNESR